MINQKFTPHEFWLLHGLVFLKRSELLQNKITTLAEVDALYLEHKNNRSIKALYGYEGSIDYEYNTESLFDVMICYLIKRYPEKYEESQFRVWHTLTRKLYLEYKNYFTAKKLNKNVADITIKGDYCECYYDFIGVTSLEQIKKHNALDSKSIKEEIIYLRGYYYTEEEGQLNQLLLEVNCDKKRAKLSAKNGSDNPRYQYTGTIEQSQSNLTFQFQSCEEGKNGRLFLILKTGDNPLYRLKSTNVLFSVYCSVISIGKLTSGVIGFEQITNDDEEILVDAHKTWITEEIPSYFEYFLAQYDVTSQRKLKTTRICWPYEIDSLKQLTEQERNNLETFEVAKKRLNLLAGFYQGISLNTRNNRMDVTISSVEIRRNGTIKILIIDPSQHTEISYSGRMKFYDRICKFSLERFGRKVEMLFEQMGYSEETLNGVYIGTFHNDIAGGRILLNKLKPNEGPIKPKRIPIRSKEYYQLLKECPNFYTFFSGQQEDEYADNTDAIRYRTKEEEPLPIPEITVDLLKYYEGTYQIFFLYKDLDHPRNKATYLRKNLIKSCPLSINKDGYVSIKSLLSVHTYEYYQGRAYIQGDKLMIHIYNNNWKNYHGLMIWQLDLAQKSAKLHQFTGSFDLGNKEGQAITAGRIHVIQKSKNCGIFNTLDAKLYPCYIKPYRPLHIEGSVIDLRKEFMGDNYNYIEFSQESNRDLDEKNQIHKENYANVFFKSAIYTMIKAKKEEDKSEIWYAGELLRKALEHGWDRDQLDDYDLEQFERHQEDFRETLEAFSKLYFL